MYDHLGLTQGYAHDLMRGSSAAGPAAHFGELILSSTRMAYRTGIDHP